ncbi:hypothetical protein OK344_05205 [Kaistella sp. BT6-1-3]|uniref:ABC transporter permease n=1 Tax=Kaistella yananensis TaxID=2989820 RepID=A0ABT3JLK0_9FLAO|nr:hypothetical protein [Kaistella yananensis]MCW4451601.1 hypothetical protein [Kaistella yananensis]
MGKETKLERFENIAGAVGNVIIALFEDILRVLTYKDGKYQYIWGSFLFMIITAAPALYYLFTNDMKSYYEMGSYDENGDYYSHHSVFRISIVLFLGCFVFFLVKESRKILKSSRK